MYNTLGAGLDCILPADFRRGEVTLKYVKRGFALLTRHALTLLLIPLAASMLVGSDLALTCGIPAMSSERYSGEIVRIESQPKSVRKKMDVHVISDFQIGMPANCM